MSSGISGLSELVLSLDEAYSKFLATQVGCYFVVTLLLLCCYFVFIVTQ
jgi:hypothetical protein